MAKKLVPGFSKQEIIDAIVPVRKKVRKKCKPMSDEQKIAAVERLKKARASKAPAKKKSYHEVCYATGSRELSDVLLWLKNAKEQASSFKSSMRAKGLTPKELQHRTDRHFWWYGYAHDINWYLRTGDWISDFWGEHQQMKTTWKVCASADPKRPVGHTYNVDDLKNLNSDPIITTKISKKRRKRI